MLFFSKLSPIALLLAMQLQGVGQDPALQQPSAVIKDNQLYYLVRFPIEGVRVVGRSTANVHTQVEPTDLAACNNLCWKSLALLPHFYLGYHRGRVLGAASIEHVVDRWKNLPFFGPASDATDEEIYSTAKRMFIAENLWYFSFDLLESAVIEWAAQKSLTSLSSTNCRYPSWMVGNPRMTAYAMGIAVGYAYERKGKDVASDLAQWGKDKSCQLGDWSKEKITKMTTWCKRKSTEAQQDK